MLPHTVGCVWCRRYNFYVPYQ